MKTRYILYIFLLLQGSLMSATIKHINISNVDIPVIFEEQKSLPILNLQLIFKNSGYIKDNENLAGSIYPYGYAQTSADLDDAIEGLNEIMDELLELSEIEKACQLMADEVEKTRRRVNALEYMTIPQYQETIKYIQMKLDENERGNIIRLMKVKDIMAKKEA